MSGQHLPIAALQVPLPEQSTQYPQPFVSLVAGRKKRKLGEFFTLKNFGINLTELAPHAVSSVAHHHSQQDEFIYILQGSVTLKLNHHDYTMQAGDCMGFPAGTGMAHQLVNTSDSPVLYLEVGDRSPHDQVVYPYDDLALHMQENQMVFTHKDGKAYTR